MDAKAMSSVIGGESFRECRIFTGPDDCDVQVTREDDCGGSTTVVIGCDPCSDPAIA
ncbi:hypothetical protein [Aquimarina agarilytica]|uniref:hypothetical protein n=1 Tax=Aquimarina agarilytica TaxID=1087449 RepID=UPI0012FC6466|nr:hypothetical protein [Aquimarina agarilytica]